MAKEADAERLPLPLLALLVTEPPAPPPPPTDWVKRPMALSPRVRIKPLMEPLMAPALPPPPPSPPLPAEAPKEKSELALLSGDALAVAEPP